VSTRAPLTAVFAAALLSLAAGCGGSSTTHNASTAPPDPARLPAAGWNAYQRAQAQALAANASAAERFVSCRDAESRSGKTLVDCLGRSPRKVIEGGRAVLAALDALDSGAYNPCVEAMNDVYLTVRVYTGQLRALAAPGGSGPRLDGQLTIVISELDQARPQYARVRDVCA